jgi:hypothetical protein
VLPLPVSVLFVYPPRLFVILNNHLPFSPLRWPLKEQLLAFTGISADMASSGVIKKLEENVKRLERELDAFNRDMSEKIATAAEAFEDHPDTFDTLWREHDQGRSGFEKRIKNVRAAIVRCLKAMNMMYLHSYRTLTLYFFVCRQL